MNPKKTLVPKAVAVAVQRIVKRLHCRLKGHIFVNFDHQRVGEKPVWDGSTMARTCYKKKCTRCGRVELEYGLEVFIRFGPSHDA
jgi:hypothetical protein